MNKNYNHLCAQEARLYRLNHLQEISSWDQATLMSKKGGRSRAEALAELSGIIHDINSNPKVEDWLKKASKEKLDFVQECNLREMKRKWKRKKAVPTALVMKKRIAASLCENEWRVQRPANDWNNFLRNFKPLVELCLEEADYLSDALSISPYEALMDGYEPGLTEKKIDEVFGDLKTWLPTLIKKVVKKQRKEFVLDLEGPFPTKKQKSLCLEIMALLGFDFASGRLDISTHPFCGGVPDDVRITTRFDKNSLLEPLFGTIHETGHARYEQNLPKEFINMPVGQSRSMSIHESQSLFFEMQLGCHPLFLKKISELIVKTFGYQDAFSHDNLAKLVSRVKPSMIRVDADEVTYPAHILIRYEIERMLIKKEMIPEDIPSMWDEKMNFFLGINSEGNFKDGVLQDIHWPEGLFGYFPCYTLGAMYAAQWYKILETKFGKDSIDRQVYEGNFENIFTWLRGNIWHLGSIYETAELTKRASGGEDLNTSHYKKHLESRYLYSNL
mgnify:CR=1 FL=1|tara:strand:+ start:31162 stop:32664 length:1503 start_codon:yes stop_codon:yes gene_type:complete